MYIFCDVVIKNCVIIIYRVVRIFTNLLVKLFTGIVVGRYNHFLINMQMRYSADSHKRS